MAHTNVDIADRNEEYKRLTLLEAERKFWCARAYELQAELENIPAAVREHGYVKISDRRSEITLVAKPDAPLSVSRQLPDDGDRKDQP